MTDSTRTGTNGLDRATLGGYLKELAERADNPARPKIEAIVKRLAVSELRVLLVGEAKRGKSTLGNAILGRDLLPTGVRPVTAVTTSVQTGSPERLEVTYLNGEQEQRPLGDLAVYVTESENPLNTRGVASVRVFVEDSLLEPAVLVDTPGVGSVFTHNTDEATEAMESMDLAVFVLTADPPISLTERNLLESVRARAVVTFVVLNKVDRLSPSEVEEATDFASEVTGVDRVFPCSARGAVDARLDRDRSAYDASGVGALVGELGARIRTRAEQDLVRSVADAAGRVTAASLDRVRLTRAALTAVIEDRGRDVEVFRGEVDRSAETLTQALASVSWETRDLRSKLDAAATESADRTRSALLAKLEEWSAQAVSAHEERLIRQAVVTLIERDVGTWRKNELAILEGSIAALIGRVQQQLDRVADEVGAAAQRLLGVEVRPVIDPLPVPDVGGFRFDFSPAMGWNTALIEGVRHRLPGRWRRKAIAAHLQTETVSLVDRQYGRARADLQARLEAAHRQLAREMSARVTEQREALSAALAAAASLKDSTSEQQHAYQAELDARIEHLRGLARLLGGTAPPEPATRP
ncbi:MAG: dynamin family protein [Nocardioides sp.]